jgi:hypothetical protein
MYDVTNRPGVRDLKTYKELTYAEIFEDSIIYFETKLNQSFNRLNYDKSIYEKTFHGINSMKQITYPAAEMAKMFNEHKEGLSYVDFATRILKDGIDGNEHFFPRRNFNEVENYNVLDMFWDAALYWKETISDRNLKPLDEYEKRKTDRVLQVDPEIYVYQLFLYVFDIFIKKTIKGVRVEEEFSNVLNNLGYEVKDLNSKLDNLLCIDRYIVVDGVTYGFQIKPESYLNGINQTEIKEHFFKMFNVVKSNKKVNIFVVVKKNDKFMVLTLKNGILIFQPIEKWLDRYLSRKLNSSQLNSNSIKIFEQIVEKKLN